MSTTPDWLAQRAYLSPERLALQTAEGRWTFAELEREVHHLAGQLAALPLTQGDRLAVLAQNSTAFVCLVHATARLGVILVPLNTRLTPAELAWQIADARPAWVLCDAAHHAQAQAASRAASVACCLLNALPPPTAFSPQPAFDLAAPHTILYTSGTTGQPKGAVLTFGNHWWSAIGSALNLGLHADDRWLACLPLFHVGGLSILLRSVIYGMGVVVHAHFDPEVVNAAIDAEGITLVSVVSVMLQRMLEVRSSQRNLRTLRCALLGGGPAPRPLLERCAQLGIPVTQTYGLTEAASQVATLAPAEALTYLGAAGKPLFPTTLAVHQLEGDAPCPAGEVGEIVLHGPTVTPGYWQNPEATARAQRGGWWHTGDLGYLDEAGYLHVVDRRDDLIISGGENIYPAEIEAVLLAHPAVEEAGVVGAPHPQWGQVPWAFVHLRPSATPADATSDQLRAFCTARLARYKIPAHIELVPHPLPRNASGKLLRRALLNKI